LQEIFVCQFKDRFPVSSDMLLNVFVNGTQFTAGGSLFNNSVTVLFVKVTGFLLE